MKPNDKTIGVLNDLIKINNDRVEGYEKAMKEISGEANLSSLFAGYAQQSRTYSNDLRRLVTELGGTPANDTTVSGKIYRVWMDMRSAVTASERSSTLDLCEYGEDAAQKAYKEALRESTGMPADVVAAITTQKTALRNAHDTVKQLREQQHAAAHH